MKKILLTIFLVAVCMVLGGCKNQLSNLTKPKPEECFKMTETQCQENEDVCDIAYWYCDSATEDCPYGEGGSCVPK